ncbi:exodeoxyribonuclease VII large subunit [Hydrogenoanaerobacterium sp.]|uniref:exodeoxyribonuclease VII large subunit n=1 Tax=Hydrogenoanaerobacterium sp. TaxID=2953763 RepID=UPI0028967AB2|nr:exodeoxyribonuclease VII large subunit [Hydrogenoanaerobacterium sp.]
MLNNILTVSQLNRYIKAIFDDNKQLSSLMIKGEISNLSDHFSSGHLYFSLKDAGASVKAVMFKSYAQQLKFRPQNGQKVLLSCSVSVFERDGIYQLYVYDIQPDGAGALALAYEQLKEKLGKEGLFGPEHKKPIPRMPQKIGVVTSQTGAALQDILNILGRRYPIATVVVAPVLVQGENAAGDMVQALQYLNENNACDVIILGRGGGSAEDLWAFNSEQLARTIYASHIPIISAVGHETDFTIVDFVADLRAPTPSAAAELAAPDLQEVQYGLDSIQRKLTENMYSKLGVLNSKLAYYRHHRALQSPQNLLEQYRNHLTQSRQNLLTAMRNRLNVQQQKLSQQAKLLGSLSPLQVLARGYAIAFDGDQLLTDSSKASIGDELRIQLASGSLQAQVTAITEEYR